MSEDKDMKHSEHLSWTAAAVQEEFELVSRVELESSVLAGRGIIDGGSGAAGVGGGSG